MLYRESTIFPDVTPDRKYSPDRESSLYVRSAISYSESVSGNEDTGMQSAHIGIQDDYIGVQARACMRAAGSASLLAYQYSHICL